MDISQPSSSQQILYISHNDDKIKCETGRLLKRLMAKCVEDSKTTVSEYINYKQYLPRVNRYTGLDAGVLQVYKTEEYNPSDIKDIDRSLIYHELAKFYLQIKIIPTTKELYSALAHKLPPYVDIAWFRKILRKMGYIWKIVGSTGLIVMENPKVTFERYEYLLRMISNNEKQIQRIYVDENYIDIHGNFINIEQVPRIQKALGAKHWKDLPKQRVIYGVSSSGLHCVKFINDKDTDEYNVLNWLNDELLPTLSSPSLIITSNSSHRNQIIIETPTLSSCKREIKKWLDFHDVAYDESMSKLEIFSLAEKYTSMDTVLYKIDCLAESRGHEVIQLPKCIQGFSLASFVFKTISSLDKKHMKVSNKEMIAPVFQSIIESIPEEEFKKMDTELSNEEMKIYQIDKKVDSVLDELLEVTCRLQTRFESIEDSDLPSSSDEEDIIL